MNPSTQLKTGARAINAIVIHCSATPQGQQVTVQDIDRWHKANGWARQAAAMARLNPTLKSIGYHFVVALSGNVFTGRGVDEIGAHVGGSNARSIGICMVGMRRFTPAQWAALNTLVKQLRTDYPTARICGHRDFSPDLNGDGIIQPREWVKECPTFDVAEWVLNGFAAPEAHTVKD